jgi:hypothetical protein
MWFNFSQKQEESTTTIIGYYCVTNNIRVMMGVALPSSSSLSFSYNVVAIND